jgi:hypothetical protein
MLSKTLLVDKYEEKRQKGQIKFPHKTKLLFDDDKIFTIFFINIYFPLNFNDVYCCSLSNRRAHDFVT